MHLYVMARGIAPRLNEWENDLLAQYFPFNPGEEFYKQNPQMAGKPSILQLGVRPIRLYELAFPEPCLNDVLKMLQPSPSWNPKYNKYYKIMQKLMGIQKMPEVPPVDAQTRFIPRNWVEVAGVGIKKDKYENGVELV